MRALGASISFLFLVKKPRMNDDKRILGISLRSEK